MFKITKTTIAIALLSSCAGAHAAVTPEEARKLGATLTLVGAEKAGNKDGSIPEYTGGLTTPPAGFVKERGVRPDPFADEKPLFAVDAKNMAQYADKLTEGTKALMKTLPGFRIDVYKTHRTVAVPTSVLENTVKNATQARLADDGLSVQGAKSGIPFPIPKSGNEVMFNFLARYQGVSYTLPKFYGFNVDSSGKLTLASQGKYVTEMPYYAQSKSADPTQMTRYRGDYTGPARRSGEALLAIDPVDYVGKARRAWIYMPGQRRVRVAPDASYDTPNPSSGGMATYDDTYLFNGKLDKFDFKLTGKKEMYVPYNTYRFTYNDKPEEVFGPKFINPSVLRWELHRVWVVEAMLKAGQRHIYSKRTFYVDEDSWNAVAVDQYDGRGQLWRPGFAYISQCYDALAVHATTSGHYDLNAGSYYISLWPSSGGVNVSDTLLPESYWTPDSLAGSGVR